MTSNPSGEAGRTAAKWTPGPWKVHRSFKYIVVPASDCRKSIGGASDPDREAEGWAKVIASKEGTEFTQFRRSRVMHGEAEANAKLISKAPELAAILQEIVELVRAEAQVDDGEGLKFLNASAQLVEAERILRESGALEESL